MERLLGIFRSHIFHSLWMVSSAEARLPARSAEWRHYFHRQTAGEVAGGAHAEAHCARRLTCHCRDHWRRHDGGVADLRALLVCAAGDGRGSGSYLWQAVALLSIQPSGVAALHRVAADFGRDCLCHRIFLYSDYRQHAGVCRAAGAVPFHCRGADSPLLLLSCC